LRHSWKSEARLVVFARASALPFAACDTPESPLAVADAGTAAGFIRQARRGEG
jgi:hypothetical protein